MPSVDFRTPDDRSGTYRGPEVCRLADITYRQLDWWDRTGLFVPSIAPGEGSGYQRLYSRDDVVMAAAIKRLLHLGVSIQRIRELAYPSAPGEPLCLREAVDRRLKRWTVDVPRARLELDLAGIRKDLDEAPCGDRESAA